VTLELRRLYWAVHDYRGPDAHADVLRPWLDDAAARWREILAPLAVYGGWRRHAWEFGDLLQQAYSFSRISDVLLLGYQPDLPADEGEPWAHDLHLPDGWPRITTGGYLAVFAALGMTPIAAADFDPFFHEIVAVEQDEDPEAPVRITGTVWPGLMLGEMLFSRAGVRVRAGARYAEAGIADRSVLYEVFLRRYRHTSDLSLGGGTNSQWKTDFRRDYLTATAYQLNVDAEDDIDSERRYTPVPLTAAERRDAVRHRCLVRRPEDHAGLDDSWPGCCRLAVPRPVPAGWLEQGELALDVRPVPLQVPPPRQVVQV
jgi:hypothetical protein